MTKRECKKCGNTGWIETVEKREKVVPYREPGSEDVIFKPQLEEIQVVVPCPVCSKTKTEPTESLNIPGRFSSATMENFESGHSQALKKAKKTCAEFIENFGMSKEQSSILLMGPPGVGKTHLAVGMLRAIAGRFGIKARFWDFREILSAIRMSYSEQRFGGDEQILESIANCDLIVIDELGSEQMTSWVKEIVHRLIIPRYNNNLPTIFTTNFLDPYTFEELKNLRTGNEDFSQEEHTELLADRVGIRLQSKLYEMCQILPVNERDYRIYFTRKFSSPDEKNKQLYTTFKNVKQHFYKLAHEKQEAYRLDAVRYNHTIALHHQEKVAIWIYARQKSKIPQNISLRQFIGIMENIEDTKKMR